MASLPAQILHENVLAGLKGEALLTELIKEFKPLTVLDYSVARDTLFGKIDAVKDSLECIYTGLKLYITPGQDATTAVYLGGIPNGINTEHTWPQSKGAIGMAQSDMHHLYPSRIKTNADRGDFPFGEIPDNQTAVWYYKNMERNTPPGTGRDLFSEGIIGRFEPRESVKGNIARSIFYFYTMYKDQANTADPFFFELMRPYICDWNYLDPVDKVEWERNLKIAKHQGGKRNPFVLDCSLVSRAYCNNIDQVCESLVLSQTENKDLTLPECKVFPNPGSGTLQVLLQCKENVTCTIKVTDLLGVEIHSDQFDFLTGSNVIELDLSGRSEGLYFIYIIDSYGKFKVLPYTLLK